MGVDGLLVAFGCVIGDKLTTSGTPKSFFAFKAETVTEGICKKASAADAVGAAVVFLGAAGAGAADAGAGAAAGAGEAADAAGLVGRPPTLGGILANPASFREDQLVFNKKLKAL